MIAGYADRGADVNVRLSAIAPAALYLGFAALVYWVHGPEPELGIDHLAYMQMADAIREAHPAGGYWRSFDSLHGYAVMIAYASDVTGSHIISLKLLLAGMTIAYLFAAQGLALYLCGSAAMATAASLVSALYVSFGATFWGLTDFTASLNRTVVVPFFVLVLWMFLRYRDSGWRYAAYPVLIVLSLLHLSAYHMLLVLFAYEVLELLFVRRLRVDRRLLHCAVGIGAAIVVRTLIEVAGLGASAFVENTIQGALAAPGGSAPLAYTQGRELSVEGAWAIELYAFPWRNLPPSLATLGNIALSYGVILVLSIASAFLVRRRLGWSALDRVMLVFAGAVVAASYGIQTLVWIGRAFLPLYPINFEEVRALSFLMVPSIYFVGRLVADLLHERDAGPRRFAAVFAIVAAFVLQPIHFVRASPVAWREGLLGRVEASGLFAPGDTARRLYARQYLGIAREGPRFYYSTQGVVDWLRRNALPQDRVLTDRNELGLAGLPVVGAFQTVVKYTVTDPARDDWKQAVDAVRAALESRDLARVRHVARGHGATLIVVPWPEVGALYQDGYFSIVRAS
jgi:hypothetical protein